jgi:hypothetical protein
MEMDSVLCEEGVDILYWYMRVWKTRSTIYRHFRNIAKRISFDFSVHPKQGRTEGGVGGGGGV